MMIFYAIAAVSFVGSLFAFMAALISGIREEIHGCNPKREVK